MAFEFNGVFNEVLPILLFFLFTVVISSVFWIWMIIDCIKRKFSKNDDKLIWSLDEDDNPVLLLWMNGQWEPSLNLQKKEAIINIYKFCVKESETIQKISNMSEEELLEQFKHGINKRLIKKKKGKVKKEEKTTLFSRLRKWLIRLLKEKKDEKKE